MGINTYLGDEPHMRYQERGLVHKLGLIACTSGNRINQSYMEIKSNKQSINHKENTYVGLPLKPIYFA